MCVMCLKVCIDASVCVYMYVCIYIYIYTLLFGRIPQFGFPLLGTAMKARSAWRNMTSMSSVWYAVILSICMSVYFFVLADRYYCFPYILLRAIVNGLVVTMPLNPGSAATCRSANSRDETCDVTWSSECSSVVVYTLLNGSLCNATRCMACAHARCWLPETWPWTYEVSRAPDIRTLGYFSLWGLGLVSGQRVTALDALMSTLRMRSDAAEVLILLLLYITLHYSTTTPRLHNDWLW